MLVCQNHLEALLQDRLLGPTPELMIQYVWGQAQEFIFLTDSQMVLMLLVENC